MVSSPELLARLTRRAERVMANPPPIPEVKALLSTDGGVCPQDGTALTFDPWSPDRHRCPHCGQSVSGERHHRHWARLQHLWLAERTAELAAVGVLGQRRDAVDAALALLRNYGERYFQYPNVDNVLGPARLFFSTYLESVWLTTYLGAAGLLRDADLLDEDTEVGVVSLADEAANLIGDYNEGFSNRQTWHNAALAAVGVWFEDEGLAATAIEGPTGLQAHLVRGFGDDGMWYEGENYHLFALRGLLFGLGWARRAGVDLFGDPQFQPLLRRALLAPSLSALPDLTFPARKDSRYGVSLAQPMYLEGWEVGAGRFAAAGADEDAAAIAGWLAVLYAVPAPPAQTFESYLHEAGEPPPSRRSRADLSWWALVEMAPDLNVASDGWRPPSAFFPSQGLAVLRNGDRYASLESGIHGGGHGHPDRLHLTLHADGVHWLPDFGTGSYVTPDLFWYRSTLAHNAPRIDGVSQPADDATCEGFGAAQGWSWARGRFGDCTRTLVLGPNYLIDVLDYSAGDEHLLELPWHVSGELQDGGAWETAALAERFVTGGERRRDDGTPPVLRFAAPNGAGLVLHLAGGTELLRATAPGAPGRGTATFYLQRVRDRSARLAAVLLPERPGEPLPGDVTVRGDTVEVRRPDGVERVTLLSDRIRVEGATSLEVLSAVQRPPGFAPVVTWGGESFVPPEATALWVDAEPALDGTRDGFDDSAPLTLETEDQYRRSEEPYPGPDELAATAWVNWSDDALFVAVEVQKPEPVFRADSAPPLRLDNEPDDIHSDGLQLHLRGPDGAVYGWLIVPSTEREPALRVRPVEGTAAAAGTIAGAWAPTDTGYTITLRVDLPGLHAASLRHEPLGLDILVNEILPGRERRAGQLVWSGGGGWVWLRGDRQDPARFGRLRLEH